MAESVAPRPVAVHGVEGARALAAMAVLLTHAASITGFSVAHPLGAITARLGVGVTVFFVLAGFLLYRPWASARLDGTAPPRLGRYAARRAARILPAYWLALAGSGALLAPWLLGAGPFDGDWWIYFGLLQSWTPEQHLGGLFVAWSLSTEVAFYVALPLLAVLLGTLVDPSGTRERRARRQIAVLAGSAVAAVVLRHAVDLAGVLPDTFLNTLPALWAWFATGMGLAVAAVAWGGNVRPPRWVASARRRPWAWWALAVVALLLAAFGIGATRTVLVAPGPWTVLAEHLLALVVAVGLLGPVLLARDGPCAVAGPVRLLAWPPVRWLGLVSYGVFLWHDPLRGWVSSWLGPDDGVLGLAALGLLGTVVVVPVAAASWYAVERPALRRAGGARRTRSASEPPLEPAP